MDLWFHGLLVLAALAVAAGVALPLRKASPRLFAAIVVALPVLALLLWSVVYPSVNVVVIGSPRRARVKGPPCPPPLARSRRDPAGRPPRGTGRWAGSRR